jgi:hypothetical protein
MRSSLLFGLAVGAVGCGFRTEELRLGSAVKDTGVDAPRAIDTSPGDTGAVETRAVDVVVA